MTLGKTQAEINAEFRSGLSSLTQGTCIAVDWSSGLVKVNIGGGEVQVPMSGRAPFPNDRVWIGYLGQQPVCIGAVPKAATGTINGAAVGGKIPVNGVDGVTYRLPWSGPTTPTSGQRVGISWDQGGLIIPVMSADPTVDTPVAPPSVGGGTKTAVFYPIDSGSATSAGFVAGAEVNVSDSYSGFYFYGTQMRDTIPNSATIDAISMELVEVWNRVPGAAVRIGMHDRGDKSGGAPPITQSVVAPTGGGWFALPNAWGEAFRNGSMFGVGAIGGVGWLQWGPFTTSGTIAIKYTT